MTEDEQFEALYGPLAPFSDHKKGETITFREHGVVKKAEILWVATPGMLNGKLIPVRYIVDTGGFPSIVYHGEVIEE